MMDDSVMSFSNETVMVVEDIDDTVCSICLAEFLDEEDLKTHVAQVHLSERRRLRYCELCSKIFPDLEQYMSHLLFVHLAKLKCCQHCFRLFPDIASKINHEKKHKYKCKKEIFCSQCDACFNERIYLERHEYSAHNRSGDGIMINHGFSLLSSLLNMNVRRFFMGFNEDIAYICASCQFTSHNMQAYINHLQKTSCKTFSCDMCVNVYHNRKNIKQHFTSKHGKHNIVECPKCHVMYTKCALNVHEKTCSLLNCLECNLRFNSVNEITNHRMEKHKGSALVNTCRFCSKQIVGDGMMKKHIDRAHKNNLHLYKYKCVYCDIIYKHPKQLFGHFFSRHRDLEPYSCMYCNKTFRVRKKFTLHIQSVHKNIGFLEYNNKYHVSFRKEKSEKPFVPQTLYEDFYRTPTSTQSQSQDNNQRKEITQVPINIVSEKKEPLIKEQPSKKETIQASINELDTPSKIETIQAIPEEKDIQAPDTSEKEEPAIEVITLDDDPKIDVQPQKETDTQIIEEDDITTRKFKRRKSKVLHYDSDESSAESDMPLIKLKRKYRSPWNSTKNKKFSRLSERFVCKKCNKNCFTLQNFKHHMSLHAQDGYKKCFICKARFKRERNLNKHIEEAHTNSALTETLKKVLERRKLETEIRPVPAPANGNRFKVVMKKVVRNVTETPATLKEVTQEKVSAKNFIENFMPDVSTDSVKITNSVTMGLTTEIRPQKILVHKCDLKELSFTGLKLPVKASTSEENHLATVKIVELENPKRANLNYGTKRYNIHDVDHSYCEEVNYESEDASQSCDNDNQVNDDNDKVQYIPEVAQEVMLSSDDVKLQKTIIIPNDPKAYKSIRIGTLQPQAPYYKIMKLDEIINQTNQVKEKKFSLPDGTQLVSVNPLAHLIDTEGIKKTMPKKYYQCKQNDIGAAISKFLNNKPNDKAKSKSRKRKTREISD